MKKSRRKIHTILSALVSCVVLIGLSACDDDDDSSVTPDNVAYVSLYNASPDSPDLDIIVDNNQINTYPFDYADYTGYLRFYTGDRNLRFGPFSSNNILLDTTVTFEPQEAYSVFVVNAYPDLEALILNDPFDTPAEGNAMVRFVNLSPDAPSLEVVQGEGSESMLELTAYKTATDFTPVSASEYDLMIQNEMGDITLDIPDVNFQSGWFYTIVAKGFEDPNGNNTQALSAEIIVN